VQLSILRCLFVKQIPKVVIPNLAFVRETVAYSALRLQRGGSERSIVTQYEPHARVSESRFSGHLDEVLRHAPTRAKSGFEPRIRSVWTKTIT